ncbi:MAG TPA: M48 family metalloprotease [Candidatus Eisenbacteria bacterium]|nr:M48 family metalloprotease [Candidatus Eisenbacteria bacterium]
MRRRSRTFRTLALPTLILLLAVVALGGCASARRATQKPFELDDAQERVLGARLVTAFEDSESLYIDKPVLDYVNQIGQKLARLSDRPTIPYSFRLLRGDAPRGVVLPGGYNYLSVGLLRQMRSQCEVAAVLAHMLAHAALGHPAKAIEAADGVGPNGIREILDATDRTASVARAAEALRGYEGFPREWESDADKLTLLYLSRIGLKSDGYPMSIETFLPPVAAAPIAYWERADGKELPLAKRLDAVRGEVSAMGLDAGLPCEQSRWAPVRARLGATP